MKLLKLALLGSAALTMSAATAVQAGDLAVIKSPGEGFWIGGGIGGQFAIGDAYANFGGSESGSGSAVPILSTFGGVVDDGDLETESFFGTVGAGYDMQVNQSLVVGIFGDYSFASDATANLSGGGGFIDGGFVIDASFAIGDNWFIGGRVGYLVTPETLFYGLVGYSQFDVGAKLDAHGVAVLATVFSLVMSNVGATVLLVPLAVSIAVAAGANPALFALTVAISTSNSFIIPTHQVNALIMGPAGYKVIDFVKSGGIMTILFLIVSLVMLNVVF